ncbi:hypothetical protein B0H14DRAFT_2558634 [Mycena olivaceomarginata]|nr:hypothetical protein B0H14DRAFT_2558634 [Mycena olivaceomarginata]
MVGELISINPVFRDLMRGFNRDFARFDPGIKLCALRINRKLLVAHGTMSLNCSFPVAVVFLKVQWDGSLHCNQPVYITYKGYNDVFATVVIVNEINRQKINV